VIVNKQARDLKISMLITKPFALGDDTIRKQNDQIAITAYNAIGFKKVPKPALPRSSFVP